MDLLIGANLDEGSLYLAPLGLLAASTDADVHDVAARFHTEPDAVVRDYRQRHPSAGAAELRVLILGDGLFGSRWGIETHRRSVEDWLVDMLGR
ncbi:hypothetical protein ADL01_29395 [Streptomyces sp. NRRL WC-3618]|nr:hypothetical protein ADL01_29395 [Streptomyces sp. NRRL WC-3618]